jgi:hypothetical protein
VLAEICQLAGIALSFYHDHNSRPFQRFRAKRYFKLGQVQSQEPSGVSHHSYLIIAGTTRAGTTSLFIYLADHPEVCGANLKETRFFFDGDYPLPAKYRFEDGLDKYSTHFNHCQGQRLRLEATPDYLYAPGAPQKIKASLPDARLIFILREPIERLISWYQFARQIGHLPAQVSFEEYVYRQFQQGEYDGPKLQHMRALEQGRYSIYLRPYFDAFERDCLCVLQYEALKRDAAGLLVEVCQFAGIDPSFYHGYKLQVFNAAQNMRSSRLNYAYRHILRGLRMQVVYDRPRLRAVLRFIRRRVEPLYLRLNRRSDKQPLISEPVRALLEEYYVGEPAALARLLGCTHFSWKLPESIILRE